MVEDNPSGGCGDAAGLIDASQAARPGLEPAGSVAVVAPLLAEMSGIAGLSALIARWGAVGAVRAGGVAGCRARGVAAPCARLAR